MSSPQTTTVCMGNVYQQYVLGVSLTPAIVATITVAEQNFTIPGLKTTDVVYVTCGVAQTAGVGITSSWVSAANTLTVGFVNPTVAGVTPAAGIYYVMVMRAEGAPNFPSVIS